MNKANAPITELCETWWSEMADAARPGQHRFAAQLLRLLGWEQPLPFSPKEGAARMNAQPYLLRAGGQTSVAAYFLLPGALESPGAIADRGLDFCKATRVLVSESQTLSVQYLLATDFYRSYLYDTQTEDLLLYADTPKAFNDEMVPVLCKAGMERGALEEVRRPPRTEVAGKLREWSDYWIAQLCHAGGINEERASKAVDRLWIIRYLIGRNIFRRAKWSLEERFSALLERAASHRPEGVGREFAKLCNDIGSEWNIAVFQRDLDLEDAIANDVIAAGMLTEFGLLSNNRFSIATMLESFNSGDPTEKMRVRMVPDVNEERERFLAKQSLDTIDNARIEIDLLEEGYRAIFFWFDRVVALYDRLNLRFEEALGEAEEEGSDLFGWSEREVARPEACGDARAYACERGLGVYYANPRQLRIARLMLTLHLIDKYHQLSRSVNRIPGIEATLMPRPRVLSAGKVIGLEARRGE
jgi:hypothetical protein